MKLYVMNMILKISAIATLLLIPSIGINTAKADINGHGVHFGPEFGGGRYVQYSDGLTINHRTFGISHFSQQIETQNLYVGTPATIKLKIFHNLGSYAIQDVALFLNLKGSDTSISQSDTWIQYDKYGGVSTHDPHNIFGDAKVDVTNDKYVMYITFKITPKSSMDASNMLVRAVDYNLSFGDVAILDAIKISYVPSGYH